jgi:hypothetical protein
MFRYKCTVFGENKMPVLKTVASGKLLFARIFSLYYNLYLLYLIDISDEVTTDRRTL